MVPTLSVAFMLFDMLFGIFIPVFLAIFFHKKYGCRVLPFWVGCAVMLVFAFCLERLLHTFIYNSQLGEMLKNNIWLNALYGGLMAGVFEETGRLLAMKLVLK
ncbi:MAG: YhfC family intramembrane metalloprotease [Oscillospiraceae bacterium]|nr:YhfC family intramembrane metalloprotease [Oscillospiraceae bacterium]